MTKKVAIITGGASGFGLAVAKALASRGVWETHLLDLNAEAGKAAAAKVPNSQFHEVNVTSYRVLSTIFDEIFKSSGSIDFVFANAGIVERDNFYEQWPTDNGPPPEPNQLSVDINLKSVINTTYLAQHYFRASPHRGREAVLVMTSSSGGVYPSYFCPMYTAAKHGVIGLMRATAKDFYKHGIRTAAICPGSVRTNLLDSKSWDSFPKEYFTPVEKIVDAVLMCIDGGDMVDSKGIKVPADRAYGLTIELNGQNFYFREQPEYCDDNMRRCMEATSSDSVDVK